MSRKLVLVLLSFKILEMKKSVLLLASALLIVSCSLPEGGNKGRLKKTDDVVRYDDPNAPHGTHEAKADTVKTTPVKTAEVTVKPETAKVDSVKVK